MKRLIAGILSLVLCFSMCACGSGVSQSAYDALEAENQRLTEENEQLRAQLEESSSTDDTAESSVEEDSSAEEMVAIEVEEADPNEEITEQLIGEWMCEDGLRSVTFNEDGTGAYKSVGISFFTEGTTNFTWTIEDGTVTTTDSEDTIQWNLVESDDGVTLVNPENNAVRIKREDYQEQAVITNNNGETETLRGWDLLLANGENELRFESTYVDAPVSLVSYVTEIETDLTTEIEDLWYHDMTVIHLAGGWIVSVDSSDPLLTELNIGDMVQADGYITGMSFMDGIAIVRTNGHSTTVTRYDGSAVTVDGALEHAQALVDKKYIEDAYNYLNNYLTSATDISEDDKTRITDFMTAMLADCYENTFVIRYDAYFSTVDLKDQPQDNVYDYNETAATIYANTQVYTNYLQNRGFTYEGNTTETIAGETEQYATLTKEDGTTIKMAMGYTLDYVRVIVYGSGTTTITVNILQ